MDNNEIAKKLVKFGNREARLIKKLAAVQCERCELLQEIAGSAELEPDVVALTVAPKDDD